MPYPVPTQPEVHLTEVDGVPCYWSPRPGPLMAGLVIGGGLCVEPPHRRGVQHTIEHLVLSTLSRQAYDYNGQVTLRHVSFHARGQQDEVADFMAHVTRGLADLPTERHDTEPGVLQAEAARRGSSSTLSSLLNRRYGSTGPGVVHLPELAVGTIDHEELRRWCAASMHRGNAALWASGDPGGLDLSALPDGPTPPPWQLPPGRAGREWSGGNAPGGFAAVAVLERHAHVAMLEMVLYEHLMDRLRHRKGVTYDVATQRHAFTGEVGMLGLFLDGAPERAADLRDGLLDALDELATSGPDREVLTHIHTRVARATEEVDAGVSRAVTAAEEHVLGRADPLDTGPLERFFGATVDDVRDRARLFLDDAQWIMPTDAGMPPWRDVPRWTPWSPADLGGREIPARGTLDHTVKASADGLTVVHGPERIIAVRFDEAVALEAWDDGTRVLHGADGLMVSYDPEVYAETDAFVAWLDGAVAPELVLRRGPRPATDGR